jgi:6-phosphofructokinase 1
MAAPRRIGVLTGGGDVPGLNSVIKSVVYRATDLGYEALGIRRGWEGLTHQRRGPELDPEYVRVLDRINTRTIDRTGGTVLHSSRTNPRKMRTAALPGWLDLASIADRQVGDGVYDLTDHVLETIEHLILTHLVSIGGRRHAVVLSVLAERGFPWSPSQDDGQRRPGTEYRIGFSSAITRAKELINRADHAGQPRADRRVPDLRP